MSNRLDWKKAKPARPTMNAAVLWTQDDLARRARRELAKWKRTLPKPQRRRLEQAL